MARKPNEGLGTIDCPVKTCDQVASVRKMKKGRREGELYAACPSCGVIMLRGKAFQEHLLHNGKMASPADPDPDPAPAPEPAPAAPPKPAIKDPPRSEPARAEKSPFFNW